MLAYEFISIKSKIGVEFRRYALKRQDVQSFDSFYQQIEKFHQLSAIPFVIFYVDPEDFLLPINNDDNLAKAISTAKLITLFDHTITTTNTNYMNTNLNTNNNSNYANNANANSNGSNSTPDYHHNGNNHHHHHHNFNQTHHHQQLQPPPVTLRRPFLKLLIEKKGIFLDYYNGNLSGKYKKSHQPFKGISNLILPQHDHNQQRPSIGMPEDFRQVSSIIDVDIVPETCRRVRIVKHGSDRPLGFYIRDGTYKRMNAQGQMELVTGIFISRLVPGGLAESTGLLAVNDEVLEVNGIQVTHGKTLDQVTDMMVANSSNLIITIRPGKLNNLS